ncbi:MAG: VanZ family protein [Lachnospiraceae bacterium]|nr:VanZ family protein [Lachnospiraceae bacterium]
MTEISFFQGELLLTAVWIAVRACVWLRQKHIDGKRELALLLMYVNLFVLIRITFFPAALSDGRVQPLIFDPEKVFPLRVNFVPFVRLLDFRYRWMMLLNVLGNVALFIPTGILMPLLWPRLDRFPRTVAAGLGLSLCIELLQLPFYARVSDIDDLIMNTLGAAAGYGILVLARRLLKKKTDR